MSLLAMITLHILILPDIKFYFNVVITNIVHVLFLLILYSFPYFLYRFINLIIKIIKYGPKKLILKSDLTEIFSFFIISILIMIFLIVLDVFLFRGYYTMPVISKPRPNVTSEERPNLSYTIQNSGDGWDFKLKNNSFSFYYFLAYRDTPNDLILSDKSILLYATRINTIIKGRKIFDEPGFDCGVGLSYVIIFPREEIRYRFDNIYDLISEYHYFELSEIDELPQTLEFKYYLPIYKMNSSKIIFVTSNSFNLNTNQLMPVLYEKTKEIREMVERFKKNN
jgi:hypothetical protein